MHDVLRKISLIGIVPVIKIDDVNKAVPLAKALCEGGIPVAEITFRTEQAEEAIARISRDVPDMLIGAGTVLTTEQANRAIDAGAKFIVSPGLNPEVVTYCMKQGVPITPGCISPSEIEQAIALGLEVVKFFPAEVAGGIKMIKALSAPYGSMRFIPTGGIDADNINDYLSFSKVLACGGSFMVPEKLLKENNFNQITLLAREAIEKILGFGLSHIGINCDDDHQANAAAGQLAGMFDLSIVDGGGSVFAGSLFELMKLPVKGSRGHIAVKTNYIERAVFYLSGKGYEFDETTARKDENGKLKSIYLRNEICGFGIHLV